MFEKYPKIRRIDSDDVKKILDEKHIIVTEKLDGCGLQVYKSQGVICGGKRSCQIQVLGEDSQGGQFSEFCKWIQNTNWTWLPDHIKLFGEGLKGKRYGKDLYKSVGRIQYKRQEPFVLFDMFDMTDRKWISPTSDIWKNLLEKFYDANDYAIPQVPILSEDFSCGGVDDLKSFFGKSEFCEGVDKEGIVLKKFYDDGSVLMAKFVSSEFQEFQKSKRNPKGDKFEEIADSVVTKARVAKLMKKYNINDVEQMGKLIGLVSKDIFDEEENYLRELSYKIMKKKVGKKLPKFIREYFSEVKVKDNLRRLMK